MKAQKTGSQPDVRSRRRTPQRGWRRPGRTLALAGLGILLLAAGLLTVARPRPPAPARSVPGMKPISRLSTADQHSLLFSRSESGVTYFGHHGGLLRSEDGGESWSPLRGMRGDAMQLTGPLQAPETLYATGHHVFLVSRDGGRSWSPARHDLPDTDIHGFAVVPSEPLHLYVFVVGHGLFESRDGGQQWTLASEAVPGGAMAVVYVPGQPGSLFVGTMRQGIGRSTDGGRTWTAVGREVGPAVTALANHPEEPGTLYAAGQGLYVSSDLGETWEELVSFGQFAMAIAIDPADPETILIVDEDGNVYRSRDGGRSWGG